MTTTIVEPEIPHDLNAESQLVGAILVAPEILDVIADALRPQDFYDARYGLVFGAAQALAERGDPVDQVTVAHEIGSTADWGLLSRLTTDVIATDPTTGEHWARIIADLSTRRRAITVGGQIVKLAYDTRDTEKLLSQCESLVTGLTGFKRDTLTPLKDILDSYWEQPGVMVENTTMLRTGYGDLDKILCGIGPGNLCLVASRPGMGKSNFLLSVGRNAAMGQRWNVAIVSLEMDKREWVVRLLARETGVAGVKIRDGNLKDHEQMLAFNRTQELSQLPIFIRDRGHDTVEKIRGQARQLRAAHGLDLLIIDYLQLINGKQRQSRYEEISAISRALKILASELEIPIIAAAQLNREVEHRKPPRPTLADLRDSGSLEQDADQVLLLYRADKYVKRADWKAGEYPAGKVEVIVGKNRHGPTGSAWVRIDDATGRIDDVKREEPAPWAK